MFMQTTIEKSARGRKPRPQIGNVFAKDKLGWHCQLDGMWIKWGRCSGAGLFACSYFACCNSNNNNNWSFDPMMHEAKVIAAGDRHRLWKLSAQRCDNDKTISIVHRIYRGREKDAMLPSRSTMKRRGSEFNLQLSKTNIIKRKNKVPLQIFQRQEPRQNGN